MLVCILHSGISFAKLQTVTEYVEEKIYVNRVSGEKDIILVGNIVTGTIEDAVIMNTIISKLKEEITPRYNISIKTENETGIRFTNENYEALRQKNISYALNVSLNYTHNNYNFTIKAWDVYKKEKILEESFTFTPEVMDNFIKVFATQIYEFFTGEFGFFYGKLLYTVTERPGVMPFKRIVVSNKENGFINAVTFGGGDEITFNPHYCSARKEVFYIKQKKNQRPKIFITNKEIGSTSQITIPQLEALNKGVFSLAISKDCSKIALSVTESGGSNIYLFERDTKQLFILTSGNRYINTSPSFFNNDRQIIFV